MRKGCKGYTKKDWQTKLSEIAWGRLSLESQGHAGFQKKRLVTHAGQHGGGLRGTMRVRARNELQEQGKWASPDLQNHTGTQLDICISTPQNLRRRIGKNWPHWWPVYASVTIWEQERLGVTPFLERGERQGGREIKQEKEQEPLSNAGWKQDC